MQARLIPAYGRRFENAEEMLQAWKDGKDFQIWNGPYCSIRDIETMQLEYDINSVELNDRYLYVTIYF